MNVRDRSVAYQLQVAVEYNNHCEFSMLLTQLNNLTYENVYELCKRVFMDEEMGCKLHDQDYYFNILVDIIEGYYKKNPLEYINAVVKGFSENFYAEGWTTVVLSRIEEKDEILNAINKLEEIDQEIFQHYFESLSK